MTQTQKAEAETTVLLFARLLARAYAFNSVKGFLSDFKAAQLRWSAYAERPFFEHVFYRTGMLLKVLKKEKLLTTRRNEHGTLTTFSIFSPAWNGLGSPCTTLKSGPLSRCESSGRS